MYNSVHTSTLQLLSTLSLFIAASSAIFYFLSTVHCWRKIDILAPTSFEHAWLITSNEKEKHYHIQ
jgi:hypothetical protein